MSEPNNKKKSTGQVSQHGDISAKLDNRCGEATTIATNALAKSDRKTIVFEGPNIAESIPIEIGKMLSDHIRIDKEIGEGGMGKVYLGFDINLKRPVAIKTIHPKLTMSIRQIQRLQLEAEVAATLSHPNIVQLYEIVELNGKPCLVMEYIEGIRLDFLIRHDEIDQNQLIDYLIPVCHAVNFAHSRGILHRDIKPGNIMVTKEGIPKIMDFGLAKRLQDDSEEVKGDFTPTVEGLILGSPAFMSPEQARGSHQTLDNRSDVYSLGATLYLGLAKRTPFRGNSSIEVVSQILSQDTPPPTTWGKNISADLEGICMKAIEKKPENRYGNAQELADDLSRFRKGIPVRARRYGFREKVSRAIKREKETFFLSLIAVGIMLLSIFYTLSVVYRVSKNSILEELRTRVKGIAATSSLLIDPKSVEAIQSSEDKNTVSCRKLVSILKEIKKNNERIEFIWIMRRSQKRKGFSEFIIENSVFDSFQELDSNQNGILDPEEEFAEVGTIYEESQDFPELEAGYNAPAADRKVQTDKWNVSLSGYAPIRDADGKSIAVLGVDVNNQKLSKSFMRIDRAYQWTVGLSVLLSLVLVIFIIIWIIGRWEHQPVPL